MICLVNVKRNLIVLFCCQCAKINKSFGIHRQFGKGLLSALFEWISMVCICVMCLSLLLLLLFSRAFLFVSIEEAILYLCMLAVFYVWMFGALCMMDFANRSDGFVSLRLIYDEPINAIIQSKSSCVSVCASARVYGIKRTSTSNNVRLLSILILSNANFQKLKT